VRASACAGDHSQQSIYTGCFIDHGAKKKKKEMKTGEMSKAKKRRREEEEIEGG
jgi:hypothetical protein